MPELKTGLSRGPVAERSRGDGPDHHIPELPQALLHESPRRTSDCPYSQRSSANLPPFSVLMKAACLSRSASPSCTLQGSVFFTYSAIDSSSIAVTTSPARRPAL